MEKDYNVDEKWMALSIYAFFKSFLVRIRWYQETKPEMRPPWDDLDCAFSSL